MIYVLSVWLILESIPVFRTRCLNPPVYSVLLSARMYRDGLHVFLINFNSNTRDVCMVNEDIISPFRLAVWILVHLIIRQVPSGLSFRLRCRHPQHPDD